MKRQSVAGWNALQAKYHKYFANLLIRKPGLRQASGDCGIRGFLMTQKVLLKIVEKRCFSAILFFS